MQQRIFTLMLFLSFSVISFAQVINDECTGAIRIADVANFCSPVAGFTTVSSTQSPEAEPSCFPPGQPFADVWFVFTAIATDVSISIKGNEVVNPGGTIRTPQFALYSGSCGNLEEIQCDAPLGVSTTSQSFAGPLVIGQEYFIRVSAAVQRQGTFQLCVNNFNAIPDLSSDCGTGLVLCDKSPFTVPSVVTAGNETGEIVDIFCQNGAPVDEQQSTWFKWICEDEGTLEFDIDPIDPDDDLDFVLYELPNGFEDCDNKQPLRIMLSGRNNNDPAGLTWASCIGATGLRAGENDERENCGCDEDDNNYIRPVDMVAGRAYALVVLNFTESGLGFTIEFGGTGTFRGPQVDFTTDLIDVGQTTACVGQEVQFTDASFFEGGLTDWEWNFGPNASRTTDAGENPSPVSFNRPGTQQILLSVTSVDGCIVSDVIEFEVICCETQFTVDAQILDASCPDASDGAIDLSAASDFGLTNIEWDIGTTQEDIDNLFRGPYTVLITDSATCTIERTFTVGSPDTFRIEPSIVMPTCDGGRDGEIALDVRGASPPYRYNWQGTGFTDENSIDSLPIGNYAVTISDFNNCVSEQVIEVRELELELDPAVSRVVDPTCTDRSDGFIELVIDNGLGPYEFDWDGDQVFEAGENSLLNRSAGTYSVQVRDNNRCLGDFTFELINPAPVGVGFDIDPVSCFGEQDATVTAIGEGGTGDYTFRWSTGTTNAALGPVGAGNYLLTITDGNGCLLDTLIDLGQPDTIFFNNIQVEDVLCFGDATGRISILGGGGTPPYDFRVNNQNFITENTFLGLTAGTYQVELRDAEGCAIRSTVMIDEPPLLSVDAGEDRIVELGDQTLLEAISSRLPVTYQWSPGEDLTCIECRDPLALPLFSTTYVVTVTDPVGCTAEDQVAITVAKPRRIYAPTAFSPNNDGTNDFFTVYADDAATNIKSLKIYDRWGELLFEENDLPPGEEALGWDGTHKGEPMNSGVYIFVAEVEFLDGEIVLERGDLLLAK